MESVCDMVTDDCVCDRVDGPDGTGDGVADISDVANMRYYLCLPLFFFLYWVFLLCVCRKR